MLDRYPGVVELSGQTWHEFDPEDRYHDIADGRACRAWPSPPLRAVLATALAAPNYGLGDARYESALGLPATEAVRLATTASRPGLTDARVRRLRLAYDTTPWGDPVPVGDVDPGEMSEGVARSLAVELGVLQSIQLARFAEGRPVPERPLTDEQVELVARYGEVAPWFHHRFAWGWPGGAEAAVDHLRTLDGDEPERTFGRVPDGFGNLLDELGRPQNQVIWDLMAGASGNDTFLGPAGTYQPANGRTVTGGDPEALLVQLALLREVGAYQALLDGDGSGVIHEDEVERWLAAARKDPSIPPALVDRMAVGAGLGLGEDTFGWDEIAAIVGVVGLVAAVTATVVFSGGAAVPLWVQGGLVGLAALEGYASYRADDRVGAGLAIVGGAADVVAAARLLRLADDAPVGEVVDASRAIEAHPDLVDLANRSELTELIQPVLAPGRIGHALDGNVNGAVRGSGGHYANSPNVRVLTRSEPDANGVTTGTIEVRDPRTGAWIEKRPD